MGFKAVILSGVFAVAAAHGQGQIISAGYIRPNPQVLASGQVTTLFVRGITAPDAVAAGFPLPTSLSGLTVDVDTLGNRRLAPNYPKSLPLFRVHSADYCAGNLIVPCPTTEVTVQIPTESTCVPDGFPNSCRFGDGAELMLTVRANGVASRQFQVLVSGIAPHFLNSCDTILAGSFGCYPLVTHADGKRVVAANPARPGEIISVFAVGLGATSPAVATGAATPAPAPAIMPRIWLQAGFRMELPAPAPLTFAPDRDPLVPVFAGLTPGYAGLYQINVAVPNPPAGTHRCEVAEDTNMRIQYGAEIIEVCVAAP